MNYSEKECDVIVADSFRELNYKQKKLLLASVNKNNADCGKYAEALIKICGQGVYNKVKSEFCDREYRGKILKGLKDRGIVCTTLKSQTYPSLLKQIPTPPLVLYMKGNVNLLKGTLFGIVGSRKTTEKVCAQCAKISSQLSEKLIIVTGIADGADSYAVQGALPSGNIICVLPCGHGANCAGNNKTLKSAERQGLTITEFPPETPALRYMFLLRNRIIAGLCRGVLVVSAGEKSGALNTAGYSADYSRDVFAFPYGLEVPSGKGCNALIKKGASLCDCADDILSAFGLTLSSNCQIELDADEQSLIDYLKDEGETHIDKLAQALNKKQFEINALCASLEIKGLVVKTGGNKYTVI
ncbi:MAG: DNA-processing protein DprA [Candidatus Coproplasma sp.]